MKLIKMQINNFRCLKNIKISFHELSVLIGENDSGKSSILDLLDIILNEHQPEESDYYYFNDNSENIEKRSDEIEVFLYFQPYSNQMMQPDIIAQDGLLHLKKTYSKQIGNTWYLGHLYDQTILNQDIAVLKVNDLDAIIQELEIPIDGRILKEEKINKILEYRKRAPFREDWISISHATLRDFLPRFERYRSIDYQDPTNIVIKTLRTVFEARIFETNEDGTKIPISSLQDLKSEIEKDMNNKIGELLAYVQRYNNKIKKVEFSPSIDFSSGLKSGQFSIDDGRGLHWLTKSGDGTKRRLLMAFFDWDREIISHQQTRPILRGYDEPDVNLHYEAQRYIYRSIRDIVKNQDSHVQVIVCTHSLTMIDQAPALSINLLHLIESGMTSVSRIETDNDHEVEDFLSSLAVEMGITNSILFYERCFIIIEGPTEDNGLPILYRRLYMHSMIEDGIRLINIEGNGGKNGLLKLLGRNRQELTIALLDRDSQTKQEFVSAGFKEEFLTNQILYIGEKEFEDAFSDEAICICLNHSWPRIDNENWCSSHLTSLRNEKSKKFSDRLMGLLRQESMSDLPNKKPVFGREIALNCPESMIPEKIIQLFSIARKIACVS